MAISKCNPDISHVFASSIAFEETFYAEPYFYVYSMFFSNVAVPTGANVFLLLLHTFHPPTGRLA